MQKSKILIVDDNEINREICEEILCDDYQLAVAQDGESALEVARGFEPDLVLLDVMMPGISALKFADSCANQSGLGSRSSWFRPSLW
jgi:CheY-like chemotaxis protein